jgi:hypothetical protein
MRVKAMVYIRADVAFFIIAAAYHVEFLKKTLLLSCPHWRVSLRLWHRSECGRNSLVVFLLVGFGDRQGVVVGLDD